MIFPVDQGFFSNFFYRLVGITFLGLIWFHIFFKFPAVFDVWICILSLSALSFCSYDILLLWLGIYQWDSNLMSCNICNFFSFFSGLDPFLPAYVGFCRTSSSISFSRFDVSASGILVFSFFLS